MNWVKVICICELHVFFHQYIADFREERSGNVVLLMSALTNSKPEVDNYVLRQIAGQGSRKTFSEPFLPQSENKNCRSADRVLRTRQTLFTDISDWRNRKLLRQPVKMSGNCGLSGLTPYL